MTNPNSPFHPIIYVRGYAMSRDEIDATTADPFCGFNIGSTVYRAVADKTQPPRKHVFESPLVRLGSEFKYQDVYEGGYDIVDREWGDDKKRFLGSRSIIIHRYYDEASNLLGVGKTPSIDVSARKLGELILLIRDLILKNPESGVADEKDFRCYLIAHSMGGLVCRALLQNPANDPNNASRYVDKFFTYATPHNGIDLAGFNVPSWLTAADIANFSREKMAKYLGLPKGDCVALLPPARFPIERVFCMVGTNRLDYEVAFGLSRTFVGHGSDGLVRIENATLSALKADGTPGEPAAKAFAYRAHSGYFGIVNSEEAYQNLIRFLFGDIRVDIWVDVTAIRLPPGVQARADSGQAVDALYQFEVVASPRGKLWSLTRRKAEEDSVACLRHQEWLADPEKKGRLYVSTAFLAYRSKVVGSKPGELAYSLVLGVRAPDYEIERRLWIDEHYEGGYLFQSEVVIKVIPPQDGTDWQVSYAWRNEMETPAELEPKNGKIVVRIPYGSDTAPGIRGDLRFVISTWNVDLRKTE